MLFNPDPSKTVQEVLFSRKKKIRIHPTRSLDNIQAERESHHKHQGILLDEKLKFIATYRYYYFENKQKYICNKKT